MKSRKELDLNQLPSDDEQPFQEKFPQTKTVIDIDLDGTCTEKEYAYANYVTPTKVKVENETNQVAQTKWNGYYPHQTLTYVQALEAGPSNSTKLAGVEKSLQTKTTTIVPHNKVSRGSSSRDLEPKLRSPVKIAPKPPGPAMPLSYAQPFYQMQQVEDQPLQQQKLDAQPLQPQKFYALPFRPQPLYALPFQMQQLYARLLQEQQVVAQPLQQQNFYAQPFQPQQHSVQTFQQQQQPSSSAVKAELYGSRDQLFENIKPVGNVEHPLPEGTISMPCRLYSPCLHVKPARLENLDIFEFSKFKK